MGAQILGKGSFGRSRCLGFVSAFTRMFRFEGAHRLFRGLDTLIHQSTQHRVTAPSQPLIIKGFVVHE
jgi:hypothetical protein